MNPIRRILAATGLSTLLLAGFVTAPAQAAGDGLVINEVYARGGSANQPYNTKFVELFNPSEAAVSLTGYGLSYSAATNTGLGNTCVLTGAIPAKGYFLIAVGSNGSNGEALPDPDQTCTGINPSGTNGSFTLVKGDEQIDLVGWGTARRFEGAAATYTGGNTTAGAISRTNGIDTDNNAADFTFGAPTPQGAGSAEPEPPAPAIVPIAEIQGTGAETPLKGKEVTTVGVVTATYPTGGFGGIYIQTPGTGGVPKHPGDASDGIFVYSSWAAQNVVVGECVEVKGTANEYNGLTQLSGKTFVTKRDGCDPVTPTALSTLPVTDEAKEAYEGMLVLPKGAYTITNNYDLNRFGQLGLAVGNSPLYQATDVVAPGAAADAYEAENLKKLITLDDGSSWDYTRNATAQASPLPYLSATTPMRTGALVNFTKPVILDFRFQWNYQPTGQVVGPVTNVPVRTQNNREYVPPAVGGKAQLASFNVLNYFTDLGKDEENCKSYNDREGNPVTTNRCQVRGAWSQQAFEDQTVKIVRAINQMDAEIVALMEIENSAGITYVSHQRDFTLAQLVIRLNKAAGYNKWAYVPSPTVVPQSEDVIRTAFIYQPSAVQLLGASDIMIDDAFANARYPLAQKFKLRNQGNPFIVVVNHFKSKGSGEDDGTGQGLSNPSREAQARALTRWVKEMYGNQATFLVGDFNAYTKETPLQIIEGAGYTNVAKLFEPTSTSYQFGGRLGSLDHVFANRKAMQLVTGAGVWDINGDESVAMEYSRRNYNVTDFFAATPFRSSDHDPVVVGIGAKNKKK